MTKVVIANRREIRGRVYNAGEVAEFSAGEAADLISLGRARAYVEPAKPVAKEAKNG